MVGIDGIWDAEILSIHRHAARKILEASKLMSKPFRDHMISLAYQIHWWSQLGEFVQGNMCRYSIQGNLPTSLQCNLYSLFTGESIYLLYRVIYTAFKLGI